MRVAVTDEFSHPLVPEIAYQLDANMTRSRALEAAVELLTATIACSGVCWNLVDRAQDAVEVVGAPDDQFAGSGELLLELEDHPMILSYLDPLHPLVIRPRRISDLTEPIAFRGTRTYNDLFRPLAVEHMLTVLTDRMTPAAGRCFTFVRPAGVPFSDRELELATRLQPLLRAFDIGLSGSLTRFSGHGDVAPVSWSRG